MLSQRDIHSVYIKNKYQFLQKILSLEEREGKGIRKQFNSHIYSSKLTLSLLFVGFQLHIKGKGIQMERDSRKSFGNLKRKEKKKIYF